MTSSIRVFLRALGNSARQCALSLASAGPPGLDHPLPHADCQRPRLRMTERLLSGANSSAPHDQPASAAGFYSQGIAPCQSRRLSNPPVEHFYYSYFL